MSAVDYGEIESLVTSAQSGDNDAVEALLLRFRPLMRSRLHELWARLREDVSSLEWADVEAQLTAFFLMRLQAYRSEEGVYFSYYIARMLELDIRDWLRQQRRSIAVPFSQMEPLTTDHDDGDGDDCAWWLAREREESHHEAVAHSVVLHDALASLSLPQRRVIELCCLQGITEEAAARTLGISRSAVRNRLATALSVLRTYLEVDNDDPYLPTRTGRKGRGRIEEFDGWRNTMNRDDKRPDLVGVGAGKPIFLQGTFEFKAGGIHQAVLLSEKLRYVVPAGHVAGLRFFRAGVSCEKMVCLSTVVNGMTHRLIPLAPNSSSHIPFAIVEPLPAGSEIEIHIASDAPGLAIVDVGGLLMPA